MSSTTPDQLRPRESSLWWHERRPSYAVYRQGLESIIHTADPDLAHVPPAVRNIANAIRDFRNNILETDSLADLKERIAQDPSYRLARIPLHSRVLVILQGGKESASIKYFNDELVGPEVTNVILAQKEAIISRTLAFFELADEDDHLSSNHKTNHFCISDNHYQKTVAKFESTLPPNVLPGLATAGTLGNPASFAVIDYIVRRAERELHTAIKAILTTHAETLRKDPDTQAQAEKIDHWLATELDGFKLYFGLSNSVETIAGTKDGLASRFWADQQAEWSARSTHTQEDQAPKTTNEKLRGEEFDLFKNLRSIEEARAQVIAMSELQDFFEEIDYEGSKVKVLKLQVIHNIRKWTSFKASIEHDASLLTKYERLRWYYKTINSIDYILPYTDADDAFAVINSHDALVNTPSTTIDDLKDILTHDPRDMRDVSADYFHYIGTEHPEAIYVSFDAIGIGDLNARDLELVATKAANTLAEKQADRTTSIAEIKRILRNILINVGKNVTLSIQQKFDDARTIFESDMQGIKFFTMRGGDEWHAIFPLETGDSIDLDLLAFTIHRISHETDLRAVASKKELQGPEGALESGRVFAHYQSLDKNERNNATIKELEKLGLYNIVAIPGEGNNTAALVLHGEKLRLVPKIGFITDAVEVLRNEGLPISIDGVMGVMVGWK